MSGDIMICIVAYSYSRWHLDPTKVYKSNWGVPAIDFGGSHGEIVTHHSGVNPSPWLGTCGCTGSSASCCYGYGWSHAVARMTKSPSPLVARELVADIAARGPPARRERISWSWRPSPTCAQGSTASRNAYSLAR